jgi:xanthine dehydrogenase accessory factor
MKRIVIVKGGGDLATGIIHRLHRCGFTVVITEIAEPTVIRRSVAFANAVYTGEMVVEGVTAVAAKATEIAACLQAGKIPVVVDPDCQVRQQLKPWGLVDAILAKYNCGTTVNDAQVVVGVGPGFTAGQDVHCVVETMRGHDLGRVISVGDAHPNTGVPGDIGGYTLERLVKAPRAGKFRAVRSIGDVVRAGEVLAYVDDEPVTGMIDGVLRGLLYDGLTVNAGMKIGDIDPRAKVEHCWTISDKARAIGGGVLEALLMAESCSPAPIV